MAKVADNYFAVDPWKIIEEGFDPTYSRVSESVFSLANESIGVRGCFDEGGSVDSLRGSYTNGVYEFAHIGRSYRGIVEKIHFMIPSVEWLLDKLDYRRDWALLERVIGDIRAPRVENGVLEQFDGYFRLEDCSLETVRGRLRDPREYWGGDHGVAGTTQIIKQADVMALMALFPEDFSDEMVAANWDYYEPRTEHGSSLSACMYALTACRIGRLDRAWDLFVRTASIDIRGGGKQWAGEIYIGGTHPASNGGAWMIAALGFAGLRLRQGSLELRPRLPEQIRKLRFPVTADGKVRIVTVTHQGWTVE